MERRLSKGLVIGVAAGIAAGVAAGAGWAGASELAPFEITYDVRLAGLDAGEITVRLEINGDRLRYTSSVTPRGVLALLFGDTLRISARMRREDGRIVAEEYATSYARNPDKDQRYRFEAHGHSVEVLKERRVYFLPTPPGTLDEAGVQLQLTRDARKRNGPWRYVVVSNGKLKRYRFAETGVEMIATALGEIEALRVERARVRDGEDAETDHRYWLSPAHRYLPVRIERLKRGRVTRTMTVKTIHFTAP